MKTAQQNISTLPEYCYGVLLIDKSLILIKSGEMGYYPVSQSLNEIASRIFGEHQKPKTTDEIADELNSEKGITKAQRKAMEWGSQFGWGIPAATPEKWEEILAAKK